jgi:DNA mismatch repair endonuclease MutH
MRDFDWRTADRISIETEAKLLVGRRLIDVDPKAPMLPSSPRTKGAVGRVFEAAFGIPANSTPGADFPGAGIELKAVPIRLKAGEARAKERISIGMIDFSSLPGEAWDTASVRKKLDSMLLVFYRWDPLLPIARFTTLAAEMWEPDRTTLAAIRQDWETIRDLVAQGRRSDLSESLTHVLGAATKGPGHGSTSRAWSLKQPFVTWIYQTLSARSTVTTIASGDPATAFEDAILARLRPFVGTDFDRLAAVTGRTGKGGKAGVASIVRALVGERTSGRSGDFERFSVEVKIVPVNGRERVVERMSFPAFISEELAYETWEASDLLGRLNRMLIVPVHREKGAKLHGVVMGTPFFWSPTPQELEGIQSEWEHARDLIATGRANDVPPASSTRYIHVRTHGRDATDRDLAPGGIDVATKSFWLNDDFLAEILRDHDALRRPRSGR